MKRSIGLTDVPWTMGGTAGRVTGDHAQWGSSTPAATGTSNQTTTVTTRRITDLREGRDEHAPV